MGRPLKKLKLTVDQIQYLASIGCTSTEISFLAGFKDTSGLLKRFSKIIEKGKEEGKTRLRKLQWQAASKGNIVMLIWLGKQILGQAEKVEHKQNIQTETDLSGMPADKLKQIRDIMISAGASDEASQP